MRKRQNESEAIPRGQPGELDRTEFAARYGDAYARLVLIAMGIIGDRSHAEDIVQEAALIALRKLREFRPNSNFAAWMAEIVRRSALNYARKTRNRATFATDPRSLAQSGSLIHRESHRDSVTADGALIDDQVEFDDDVIEALLSLGEEARCCLLLRVVQQLPYAEISDLMNIPAGTAMSHVHRGKSAMRRRLARKYLTT